MKKSNVMQKYEAPCLEVDYFDTQDVILTSGEDPDVGIDPDEPDL